MREKADELEENMVDVRREDRTIRPFTIPVQEELSGEILKISAYSILRNHEMITKTADISLRKNQHLLISGPNGIGKSTLLESIVSGRATGVTIAP